MSEPVTKEQYEFYRSLYDEEERTSLQLEGRAKVYLGIISAFLAAVVFKTAEVKASAVELHVPWFLILLLALGMTIALILVLVALRIRSFDAVNDGTELLKRYGDNWPSQDEFFADRIVDYAVASTRNGDLNNETAALLAWSSYTMAASSVILLCVVGFAIGGSHGKVSQNAPTTCSKNCVSQ